ncbi:MAG: hypothetical protein QXX38_02005 [Candidatus Aenigmatarchaeota archaeon]
MRLFYVLIHSFIHLFLVFLIVVLLKLDWYHTLIAFIATCAVDLDHTLLVLKNGIKGYLFLRAVTEFRKPRKYFLHNFFSIFFSFLFSFLIFSESMFAVGIACLSIFFHLLWDFFEDVFIFKMGIKHWLI